MKAALVFGLISLLAVTGCRQPCNWHPGGSDGRYDGEACDLLATYPEHCPTVGEAAEYGTSYGAHYVIEFCKAASEECLENTNVAEFCKDELEEDTDTDTDS